MSREVNIIRKLLWLTAIVLAVASCRGGTAEPAPTITVPAGPDLSGISFEVHQEPG